jgi:hypothetical protein
LKRATFIPALRSLSNIATDLDDGPNVQTILVFGLISAPTMLTPRIFSIALTDSPNKRDRKTRKKKRDSRAF